MPDMCLCLLTNSSAQHMQPCKQGGITFETSGASRRSQSTGRQTCIRSDMMFKMRTAWHQKKGVQSSPLFETCIHCSTLLCEDACLVPSDPSAACKQKCRQKTTMRTVLHEARDIYHVRQHYMCSILLCWRKELFNTRFTHCEYMYMHVMS